MLSRWQKMLSMHTQPFPQAGGLIIKLFGMGKNYFLRTESSLFPDSGVFVKSYFLRAESPAKIISRKLNIC
jgi:hypothetical protein